MDRPRTEFVPRSCSTRSHDFKFLRYLSQTRAGTNAYAITDAANGVCIHAHDCRYEFCTEGQSYDLPSYTVDVRTDDDITAVLEFAMEHGIPVSVKTTGHSYTGSSTHAGSVLIWMHNFPKDGLIQNKL